MHDDHAPDPLGALGEGGGRGAVVAGALALQAGHPLRAQLQELGQAVQAAGGLEVEQLQPGVGVGRRKGRERRVTYMNLFLSCRSG